MQIIHKIDNFLFTIFPKLNRGGNDLIISTLEEYYLFKKYKLSKEEITFIEENVQPMALKRVGEIKIKP